MTCYHPLNHPRHDCGYWSHRKSGGLVIEELLDRGVESSNIVAAVHSSEKASDLADADTGIAEGYLYVEWDDLSRLIGPPTTPLSEAVADALQVE